MAEKWVCMCVLSIKIYLCVKIAELEKASNAEANDNHHKGYPQNR